MLLGTLLASCGLLGVVAGKWIQGHIDTKENWAFLARFCFLSLDGQFEYLLEFDKDMGTPNLLLYFDDDSQWPSVYHSSKTCKQREHVLNKGGQNQIVRLSHWYPDTEYSGCVITRENQELPASKSSTTTRKPQTAPPNPNGTKSPGPFYYDQFLKTTDVPNNTNNDPKITTDSTTVNPKTTVFDGNSTWYEVVPTDEFETTTEDVLWESVGDHSMENLKDVEMMFSNDSDAKHKIKRSTQYERYQSRRLAHLQGKEQVEKKTEKLVVSCHKSIRFRSARERWWFIAVSNCDGTKGLDIKYKFLMTNGPEGDFWHEHFSADEFYVLPILLAYSLFYLIVMIAVVMCSVELKSRHLLHSTYKLFLMSVVAQHCGISVQAMAGVKYAANGYGGEGARIIGQFLCGVSELTFLLLLVLMAKGYTITRGRLKASFTVKLTILGCAYCATYVALFIYQAYAFDPGEVLYLYDGVVGYCLIGQRVVAWFLFAYATFFTVNKFPEKNMFYCPFFICGSLWFHAGPLFILTANYYIETHTVMSLKIKLIKCLEDLKDVDYTDRINAGRSDAKAEYALNLIYQAGLKKTTFDAEEKKTFGGLLAAAVLPIQVNIEGTTCIYRTRLDNSVLMKRSALQFLIDNYGPFPVGGTTLDKILKDADIQESVEILDKLIERLCDLSDSDEGSSDRESAGSKKLPSTHTWWSN